MPSEILIDFSAMRIAQADCQDRYPDEACGLLIGEGNRIVRAVAAGNSWAIQGERRRRFTIDPAAQMRTERSLDGTGSQVMGTYHSHPDHPAEPSAFDLEAAWPVYLYLILSVSADEVREVRGWRIDEATGRFAEVGIHVVE
ncbi:MAG: M67 family metallopeptidase [Burkholderiales bacterium]|nr:M67 family metallopeptidase [Phycisphaerae bacterium]